MEAKDPTPEECTDNSNGNSLGLEEPSVLRVPPRGKLDSCVGTCPLEWGWLQALTVRPLMAISGRVRAAGVVSRFRALVSCSITASISCGEGAGHNCKGLAPLAPGSGSNKVVGAPTSRSGGHDLGLTHTAGGLLKMQVTGLQLAAGAGHPHC